MKLALLLVAGTAMYADLPWMPFGKAAELAASEDRPAIVYVYALWCGPCRRFQGETLRDAEVRDRLTRFVPSRLNIQDQDQTHRVAGRRMTESQWAAHLGVASTPAVVALAPDGSVLFRYAGFLPPAEFLLLLDAVLDPSR